MSVPKKNELTVDRGTQLLRGRVIVVILALGLTLCGISPADELAADTAAHPALLELVDQLGEDRFEVRVAARRKLLHLAVEHPHDLAILAGEADIDPEVATQIVRILERIFQKHADAIGDNAERALEWISRSESPVAVTAFQVLIGNARLRESRARQAIERLGGEVGYAHPNSDRVRRGHAIAPLTGVGFGEPAIVYGIWLHSDWKGTPDDLWHLRRLSQWPDMVIYSIKGNGIPLEELLKLSALIPGLHIEERGPCLGIKSFRDVSPCTVGDVVSHSAAEKAGLKINDEIVQLNDQPVRTFGHLVELLQDHDVGDDILLEIRRGGEAMTLELKLGSWRGVAKLDEQSVHPPRPFAGPFGQAPVDEPRPADADPMPTPAPGIELKVR